MALHNIVIKSRTASLNVDSLNRTAVCEETIDNGCVFALNSYSEVEGEGMVWKAEKATADQVHLWMATSPEVVITRVMEGEGSVPSLDYKGIVDDPRAFTNLACLMIDATYLSINDIIEMTCAGLKKSDGRNAYDGTEKYLVPDYGTSFDFKGASAPGNGTALRLIGTSYLHIGNAALNKAPVKTYKFTVENN